MSKVINNIVNKILDSVSEQENPDNRTVDSVSFENTDYGTTRVFATTSFEGFAEDEHVLICETCDKEVEERATKMVGTKIPEFFNSVFGNGVEELLKALEILYSNSELPVSTCNSEVFFDQNVNNKFIDYVEGLCCTELIAPDGSCEWDNIKVLFDHGYDVYAGEKDSFGWLTGCVQKNGDDRILVYG